MQNKSIRGAIFLGMVSVLILSSLAIPAHIKGAELGSQLDSRQSQTAPVDNPQFLPFVVKNYPPPPPIFGSEMESLSPSKLQLVADANIYWVRNFAISWADVEPVFFASRQYHWDEVDEADLAELASRNLKLIATIKYTPTWAQKYPSVACGPIADAALYYFASFMQTLVSRYSAPPYNVKYWEIGNEPDIDAAIGGYSPFGCWGNPSDPYFGGGYYAQMLSVVYPAVKAVDPQAKILIGGLLLDCDPTHPPPGKDCTSAKFFEGILKFANNTGAQYFDIVSFHGYTRYVNGVITEETETNWLFRGGPIKGKINYLREVMAAYGVSKPLMLTEASLMCIDPACSPTYSVFNEIQADYAVGLYARTWGMGLLGTIWFQLEGPGWRYTGLLNNSTPKPIYYAISFMAQELGGATIGAEITSYPGLKGYEFKKLNKRVWLLWSADGSAHIFNLPPNTIQVLDKYGVVIAPQSGQIIINSPVYVEISY